MGLRELRRQWLREEEVSAGRGSRSPRSSSRRSLAFRAEQLTWCCCVLAIKWLQQGGLVSEARLSSALRKSDLWKKVRVEAQRLVREDPF